MSGRVSKFQAVFDARKRLEAQEQSPVTDDSPIIPGSPTAHASPTLSESPSIDESPIKQGPVALPDGSPSTSASPTVRDSPKLVRPQTETTYRKGDSRVNNDFFDTRICGIEPLAQLLYFHLNRYRDGGSNLTVVLSWARLAERIPVSESTLRRAFALLKAAGLAFKERDVYGKGSAQGIIFRVSIPESPSAGESPSTGDTHKRKDLKDKDKREVASLCDRCKDANGFYYPEGFGKGAVAKCDHRI